MNAYTEISIVAPDSAVAGSVVEVEITIKNISDETINAIPGFATVDGISLPFYLEDIQTLLPDASYTWDSSFTMPSKSVTLHVESWWENSLALHKDNEAEVVIALVSGVADTMSTVGVLLALGLMMGMVAMIMPSIKGGFR